MKANRLTILATGVIVAVAACQAAPPENDNMISEADPATAAATDANAAPEPAAAPAGGQDDRPEPSAPRAEGEQLAEFIANSDVLFLDVRRPDEIEELGTVEGYLNIPIEELADRLDEVPRTKPILTA